MENASSQSLDSVGEEMLSRALGRALAAPPRERADLFERLTGEITATTAPGSGLRPWTCSVHTGTDSSRIFRGGLGFSIVVDPQGRLWRAGNYEDFETTYKITETSCEIVALKPRYEQMREYVAQASIPEAERTAVQAPRVLANRSSSCSRVSPPPRLYEARDRLTIRLNSGLSLTKNDSRSEG